jgi:anaerobic magnesium-protoporphyrin IX monomethyl ester cyclase
LGFFGKQVIFIVFGDYSNLGVGYLSAVLSQAGIETRMIDFRLRNEEILEDLKKSNPLVIGFSVIYEGYIDEFAKLVKLLRSEGISCHFTAGGHFASLRPQELFCLIPGIDSIIRFEGEYTLLELVSCLNSDRDWKSIRSIAYKENHRIIETQLRPLERDLDRLPFPLRPPLREYAYGKTYVTIIAGRGCINNCSYCNAKEFYRTPSGPTKRTRSPEMVVKEMEYLYRDKGCSVYLFHDDDFPVKVRGENDWIKSFCNELVKLGLHDKIIWKISCRPDEIDAGILELMKQHGLFLVFIGLEDGTDEGLARLNKRTTVAGNLECIKLLKDTDTSFNYGFMMFQPDTTFDSLRENLGFLGKVCSDGYTPVSFLKMMPYFETRVEKELREQGRLKGRPGYLDYDFNTLSLNDCYSMAIGCFAEWMWSAEGVTNLSQWARNYYAVHDHFSISKPGIALLRKKFRKTAAESNRYILDTLAVLFDLFESGSYLEEGKQTIEKIKSEAKEKHAFYRREIRACF